MHRSPGDAPPDFRRLTFDARQRRTKKLSSISIKDMIGVQVGATLWQKGHSAAALDIL
jgi:hypothetical protein